MIQVEATILYEVDPKALQKRFFNEYEEWLLERDRDGGDQSDKAWIRALVEETGDDFLGDPVDFDAEVL